MSFAQKYLDLVTECSQEIRKTRPVNFFGVEAPWTDTDAYDIIRGSVEEWEDSIQISYTASNGDVYDFEFNTWEDCLFNSYCLDDDFNSSNFIMKFFKDYAFSGDETPELLKEIFEHFKETGKISLFSTMYSTAVEAKIIDQYQEKYKALKAEYPGLPYYPSIGFSYDLTDYYESSTC